MHNAQSVPEQPDKRKRANPGASVIPDAVLKIAKALKKQESAQASTQEEISEASNSIAQAFAQYAAFRDEQMRRTWDKLQIGSGGKMYDFVMGSPLLDDEAKEFLVEMFNLGREKKFQRKRKAA